MKRCILFTLILLFGLCACTTWFGSGAKTEPGQQADAEVQANSQDSNQAAQNYYDFDDILIPQEMELQTEESIMMESLEIKAGTTIFEANVEPVSLFNFFKTNMPEDGWQLVSYFKYGHYLLVFEKPSKICVIQINPQKFTTRLIIWVTPRANPAQG